MTRCGLSLFRGRFLRQPAGTAFRLAPDRGGVAMASDGTATSAGPRLEAHRDRLDERFREHRYVVVFPVVLKPIFGELRVDCFRPSKLIIV